MHRWVIRSQWCLKSNFVSAKRRQDVEASGKHLSQKALQANKGWCALSARTLLAQQVRLQAQNANSWLHRARRDPEQETNRLTGLGICENRNPRKSTQPFCHHNGVVPGGTGRFVIGEGFFNGTRCGAGEWAHVCGFIKPPDSHNKWRVRLNGAFSFPHNTLGLKEKDQSCHHEVRMHLSHANPQGDRAVQYKHTQRLHLKERASPYDHSTQKNRAPQIHRSSIWPVRAPMITTTCTPRPSFNDLMRHRQLFSLFSCCSVNRVTLASTSHCMSHCTRLNVSEFFFKESRQNCCVGH